MLPCTGKRKRRSLFGDNDSLFLKKKRTMTESPENGIESVAKENRLSDDPVRKNGAGQLKISVYANHGLLTVHVIQARHLFGATGQCSSFVTLHIQPEHERREQTSATTRIVHGHSPVYDEKFSFEICNDMTRKRILLAVYLQPASSSNAQFLGCTSFGIHHLLCGKKVMNDWYYLLKRKTGAKKHLRVPYISQNSLPSADNSVPSVNKSLFGMSSSTVVLERTNEGESFGITVTGSCPARIASVAPNSSASMAGLQKGDCLVRINNQNVSRSISNSVTKMLNNNDKHLVLDIYRKRPKSSSIGSSTGRSIDCEGAVNDDYKEEFYEDDENIYENDIFERNIDPDDKENLPSPSIQGAIYRSPSIGLMLPPPAGCSSPDVSILSQDDRVSAIKDLVKTEREFSNKMSIGVTRYSKPLRGGLRQMFSSKKHTDDWKPWSHLFLNIEKLGQLSNIQLTQLDPDGSIDDMNVGGLYKARLRSMCEEYSYFSKNLYTAIQLLEELQDYNEFREFMKKNETKKLTLLQFLKLPVKHLHLLYSCLQNVLSSTSSSHRDFEDLSSVVRELRFCCKEMDKRNFMYRDMFSSLKDN